MNIKVPLNIYNRPWLIEPNAAVNLLDLWERISTQQATWAQENSDLKAAHTIRKLSALNSGVVFAPIDTWEAEEFKGFEGALTAVIPVVGPLMKSDFCGSFGTASLSNLFRMAEKTQSVQNIILLVDSPGGTVDGTESFASVIKQSRKTTLAVVDGYACSAAYWIGSSANEVVATGNTNIIGSIGTMVSWRDWSKLYDEKGIVLREYFATKSTDKNRAFREANAGDGTILIAEHLDPLNNEFLSAIISNRSGKIDLEKEDVLTGKTYVAKAAKKAGLIDGIMSFEKALQYSLKMAQYKNQIKMNNSSPFQRTLTAAVAAAFEVVDNVGFGLTEQQLTSIEAAFAANETQSSNLQTQLTTATTSLQSANTQLSTANTRITQLENEVADLKKGPAAEFSTTTKPDDAPPAQSKKDKYRTTFDDEADRYSGVSK